MSETVCPTPVSLLLAPMQGLCDPVMRDLLTRIGGYDGCVSEFVRITHTVHGRAAWLRHVPELAHANRTPAGTPCAVQLLGSDPDMMAQNACEAVRFGAEHIDLNFGCPAPTVNKHQGGAVLLKEPERIHGIVRSVRQALPAHIVLTAKMRLGYENTDLALDNAAAIAAGGASLLTVHARTKVQGYTPPADWLWLRRIREHVNIPVAANGDVFTLDDYRAIRETSGCTHIMLGRGAVMRPDLARQIRRFEQKQAADAAVFGDEVLQWIRDFVELCVQHEPQGKYAAARLKQWLGMMKHAYPEAQTLFERIRKQSDTDAIRRTLANAVF
ncbi:tRNA dihydrouridine synthase [Conchiformibius kuhniae]|uniref:tRNA-dihydrouridine(16) synthase n=1 Tax=Conchiformibius kuhniae TaxID=211502 RepID=A0A8T9MV25_9NEIS|nr:tRNA-dihydrouridine synthase [Conchiformibius kuhniae]